MAYKKELVIAGLDVQVFTPQEATIDPTRPVFALFLLHGRFGSAKDVVPIIDQLFSSIDAKHESGESTARDLIVVTFDHRNHGSRLVDKKANLAWNKKVPEQNNDQHALDMYSIQTGTAKDISLLIDFLPSYLYSSDERTITEWGVAGISLGGHSTWITLRAEPRIKLGIPIIGCPDYLKLIRRRAEESSIDIGPPYFPATLISLIQRNDPASAAYSSQESLNPFLGKKILVLSGGKDKLVPWTASEEFVEKLEVGKDGVKKIFVQEDAGHECTKDMVALLIDFVYEQALVATSSKL